MVGRQEEGAVLLERAVQLDPNYAIGWTRLAASKSFIGKADEAIEHYERALRLSPRDPRIFIAQAGMAQTCIVAGRLDEASAWAARALQVHPKFPVGLRVVWRSINFSSCSFERGFGPRWRERRVFVERRRGVRRRSALKGHVVPTSGS